MGALGAVERRHQFLAVGPRLLLVDGPPPRLRPLLRERFVDGDVLRAVVEQPEPRAAQLAVAGRLTIVPPP